MIPLPGKLAIKTIHGRNGDFNVGRLVTSIGEFVVKNAELDQYREGKYEGDFNIVKIEPSIYNTGGRMVVEVRALLGGMALSNLDALSKDEASRLGPQEMDPLDEEQKLPQAKPADPAPEEAPPAPLDALNDTSPFPFGSAATSAANSDVDESTDVALFGLLWPLAPRFKLDVTVDRRVIRQQRDRLHALGYEIDPPTQEWYQKAA